MSSIDVSIYAAFSRLQNFPSQDGETVQTLQKVPGQDGETVPRVPVILDWAGNAETVDCPVDLDPAILLRLPDA